MATPLPGDAVTGLEAAFGAQRVVAAYGTGPAFDIVFAPGGMAKTISFLPSGLPNYALLDALAQGATPRISRWYDQSGNGNHAVQATFAAMPGLSPASLIGAARAVLFDSVVRGTQNNVTMTLPTGVALNSAGCSIFALCRLVSTSQDAALVQLTVPGSTAQSVILEMWNTGDTVVLNSTGGGVALATPSGVGPSVSAQVLALNNSATGYTVSRNDAITSNKNAPNNNATAGGFLGTSSGNGGGQFSNAQAEFGAIILAASQTATAYAACTAACYALGGVPPQILDAWIADGDSRTEGYGATLLQGYVRQTETLLRRPAVIHDVALYGDTMANRNTNFANNVTPFYSSAAAVMVISNAAGINDLDGGTTATALYTAASAWVAKAKALGSNVVAILATVPPSQTPTSAIEAQRTAYNTAVISGAAAGGYLVVDLAGDPTVGSATVMANTAYSADGLHWTTLMSSFVAQAFAAVLNTVITW